MGAVVLTRQLVEAARVFHQLLRIAFRQGANAIHDHAAVDDAWHDSRWDRSKWLCQPSTNIVRLSFHHSGWPASSLLVMSTEAGDAST